MQRKFVERVVTHRSKMCCVGDQLLTLVFETYFIESIFSLKRLLALAGDGVYGSSEGEHFLLLVGTDY